MLYLALGYYLSDRAVILYRGAVAEMGLTGIASPRLSAVDPGHAMACFQVGKERKEL